MIGGLDVDDVAVAVRGGIDVVAAVVEGRVVALLLLLPLPMSPPPRPALVVPTRKTGAAALPRPAVSWPMIILSPPGLDGELFVVVVVVAVIVVVVAASDHTLFGPRPGESESALLVPAQNLILPPCMKQMTFHLPLPIKSLLKCFTFPNLPKC